MGILCAIRRNCKIQKITAEKRLTESNTSTILDYRRELCNRYRYHHTIIVCLFAVSFCIVFFCYLLKVSAPTRAKSENI